MPTYVYETLPVKGKPVKRYEIWQSIKADAFKKHPETGEPVRRIITGGADFFLPDAIVEKPAPPPPKKSRFDKKSHHEGPRQHYDHDHDHDHHH